MGRVGASRYQDPASNGPAYDGPRHLEDEPRNSPPRDVVVVSDPQGVSDVTPRWLSAAEARVVVGIVVQRPLVLTILEEALGQADLLRVAGLAALDPQASRWEG